MTSRILVISPHPDDEAIGCGGTIRSHVVAGDVVRALFLTSGEACATDCLASEMAACREREACVAARVLGLAELEFWREPDGAVRATRPVVCRLRATLEAWQPKTVYVTHGGEMHADHRAAARLVRRALDGLASRPTVRLFEIWTPLQRYDHVVDITAHVGAKRAAIQAHESQCARKGYVDASLGLSRYRGEMSLRTRMDYAEVFAEAHW
jgi:N-acetylglucosamine malate deacetylase 1